MALTRELRRYLVEHLAGRQSFIGEQVVFAIRSSGEISTSERLTDQQLIDHFPQLFADLVEYFLSEADPSTRKQTIEAASKHGMTRWQQDYELVEVIRELGIVHRSILEHGITKFFEENSQWVNSINDARRYFASSLPVVTKVMVRFRVLSTFASSWLTSRISRSLDSSVRLKLSLAFRSSAFALRNCSVKLST